MLILNHNIFLHVTNCAYLLVANGISLLTLPCRCRYVFAIEISIWFQKHKEQTKRKSSVLFHVGKPLRSLHTYWLIQKLTQACVLSRSVDFCFILLLITRFKNSWFEIFLSSDSVPLSLFILWLNISISIYLYSFPSSSCRPFDFESITWSYMHFCWHISDSHYNSPFCELLSRRWNLPSPSTAEVSQETENSHCNRNIYCCSTVFSLITQ